MKFWEGGGGGATMPIRIEIEMVSCSTTLRLYLYDGRIDATEQLRPVLHVLLITLNGCREVAHVCRALRAPESYNALNAARGQHRQMWVTLHADQASIYTPADQDLTALSQL